MSKNFDQLFSKTFYCFIDGSKKYSTCYAAVGGKFGTVGISSGTVGGGPGTVSQSSGAITFG